MYKLKVKILSHVSPPEKLITDGKQRLNRILKNIPYEYSDYNPDIMFFVSGGSELQAIKSITENKAVMLIGSVHNNAYASATEVKAYLNNKGIPSIIIDEENNNELKMIQLYYKAKNGINNLIGKKLGLIGSISEWLIASSADEKILKEKFGIEIKQILWNQLNDYKKLKPSEEFIKYYGFNDYLLDSAKVYQLLNNTISEYSLDAITVECFSLVRENDVTACLSLGLLNNKKFIAGCEGDTTTAVGMMLAMEVTNKIPWIANINKVNEESVFFSHCTIAPDLLKDFEITTHYETGKGTAIKGKYKAEEVTIFRLNSKFSKAFISKGKIISTPELSSACRTQIIAELPENNLKQLKNNPLGNHHIIIQGDYTEELKLTAFLLNMIII